MLNLYKLNLCKGKANEHLEKTTMSCCQGKNWQICCTQRRFHTLKGKGLLNDEVSIKILKFLFHGVILEYASQIINSYLKLLAAIRGNCHVIISQTLMPVINHAALLNKLHLLAKVSDCFYLKNIPL